MSPAHTLPRGRSGKFITIIRVVLDILMVNLAYFITVWLSSDGQQIGMRSVWALLNLVFVLVIGWGRRTRVSRNTTVEGIVNRTVRDTMVHVLFFVPSLYFMGFITISWPQMLGFYMFMLSLLTLERLIFDRLLKHLRSKGINNSLVVIVGIGPQAERLYLEMKKNSGFGYRVMGVYGPQPAPKSVLNEVYRGDIDLLEEAIVSHNIDEVYYCSSQPNTKDIMRTARACETHVVQFHFVPQIPAQLPGQFEISSIGITPVLMLRDTPLRSIGNRILKRGFDIAFSATVLLFFPLVLIPVGIAIKLSSPGPIFFRQLRTGHRGKDFWCYKFRSMKVNTTSDTAFALRNDPRKTKVGDFIRRTSIDELPQFYNVLKGDMSIVGPRPHMLKHTEDYSRLVDEYMVRHAVKPGITGWAQVKGFRGSPQAIWQIQGRVEHDIWYIEHWSFLLDLKIIVLTIYNALHGEENAF